MARTRQPSALKAVKGERKDRMNPNEPHPSSGPIECPSDLSDGAKATWCRLAPDMITKGVLTPWDVDEFATLCDAIDRGDRAREHLNDDGEVIDAPVYDRNGRHTGDRQQLSPWWQVWKGANETLLRYGARFGMSPSDRAQLKVGDGGTKREPTEDLLTG